MGYQFLSQNILKKSTFILNKSPIREDNILSSVRGAATNTTLITKSCDNKSDLNTLGNLRVNEFAIFSIAGTITRPVTFIRYLHLFKKTEFSVAYNIITASPYPFPRLLS